jgi:hypothetical protein
MVQYSSFSDLEYDTRQMESEIGLEGRFKAGKKDGAGTVLFTTAVRAERVSTESSSTTGPSTVRALSDSLLLLVPISEWPLLRLRCVACLLRALQPCVARVFVRAERLFR